MKKIKNWIFGRFADFQKSKFRKKTDNLLLNLKQKQKLLENLFEKCPSRS
jgi:hypothetical protein